jgi:hypothetical protein
MHGTVRVFAYDMFTCRKSESCASAQRSDASLPKKFAWSPEILKFENPKNF